MAQARECSPVIDRHSNHCAGPLTKGEDYRSRFVLYCTSQLRPVYARCREQFVLCFRFMFAAVRCVFAYLVLTVLSVSLVPTGSSQH